jgi:hypothetical protein
LLLQVLFTAELNRRLAAAGANVQALSLHPGNVLTNVVQSLPAAIRSAYRAIMVRVLLTPEQGAHSTHTVILNNICVIRCVLLIAVHAAASASTALTLCTSQWVAALPWFGI